MLYFSRNSLIMVLISVLMFSCSKEQITLDKGDVDISDESNDEFEIIELEPMVTSKFDPQTGELVAMNVPDPIFPPENENKNAKIEAISTVTGHSTFYRGSSPYGGLEAYVEVPTDYALTAFGGRIKSYNLTTIRVRGQKIESNGTLGQEFDWFGGSAPNSGLEAYYEVPPSHIIIGIGMREDKDNLTTLRVYYRRYDSLSKQLVGPTYVQYVGSDPYASGVEVLFRTYDEYALVDYGLSKFVLKGVGARVQGGWNKANKFTTMHCRIGKIRI